MGRRLVPFVLAAVLAAAGCAADPAAPEPAPADPAAQAADPCSDAAVHRQAEERLALAEGLATRARQDDQDGAPAEEVLAAYCGACDAAREVPAGSCARPRAEELAQRLAARLHALAVETARRRMQGPAPNWGRIRASLLEVAERVPSPRPRTSCASCASSASATTPRTPSTSRRSGS